MSSTFLCMEITISADARAANVSVKQFRSWKATWHSSVAKQFYLKIHYWNWNEITVYFILLFVIY